MPEVIQHGGSRLLPVKETAKRLCVSRRTLEREVARGKFPRPVKIGTKSLFLVSDIEKYVRELVAMREGHAPTVNVDEFDEDEEDDGEE